MKGSFANVRQRSFYWKGHIAENYFLNTHPFQGWQQRVRRCGMEISRYFRIKVGFNFDFEVYLSIIFLADFIYVSDFTYLNRSTPIETGLLQAEKRQLWPRSKKSSWSFSMEMTLILEDNNYHMFFNPGLTLTTLQHTKRRFPGKMLITYFFGIWGPDKWTICWNMWIFPTKNCSSFRTAMNFLKWRYRFRIIENYRNVIFFFFQILPILEQVELICYMERGNLFGKKTRSISKRN